ELLPQFTFVRRKTRVHGTGDHLPLQVRRRRPTVLGQIVVHLLTADDGEEVLHALPLPTGAQGSCPVRIGGPVVTDVHRGGGPLEHVQVFCVLPQVWDDLYTGGARAHDRDLLVGESGQTAFLVASGEIGGAQSELQSRFDIV